MSSHPNHASIFAAGGDISPTTRGGILDSVPDFTNELLTPPMKVANTKTKYFSY